MQKLTILTNHSNMDLNIISWNATGIMTGIAYLTRVLNERNSSVCGLSEHWLLPHNASIDSIDSNDRAHTVTCSSPSTLNGRTIGKVGVSILWHKSLDSIVQTVDINCDRIVAVKLCLQYCSILLVQVYLPASGHSIDIFKDTVDRLSDCLQHNARFHQIQTQNYYDMRTRDAYVCRFADNYNHTALTESEVFTGPRYTFVQYNNAPASRIKHILVDERLVPVVHKCSVVDDAPLNVSRHLPVHACVKVNITPRSTDSLCEPFSKICFR